MSMRDALTAALFKRNEAGQRVVYPNGVLGRGYIVPDVDAERRIRRRLMWQVIGAGLAGGVGGQVLYAYFGHPFAWTGGPWVVALSALAVLAVAHRLVATRLVSGLEPVQQRLTITEALRRQSEAMPRWYLLLLAIFSPLAVAGGLYWLITAPTITGRLLGLSALVLFGSTTAQAIYGLRVRPGAPRQE